MRFLSESQSEQTTYMLHDSNYRTSWKGKLWRSAQVRGYGGVKDE